MRVKSQDHKTAEDVVQLLAMFVKLCAEKMWSSSERTSQGKKAPSGCQITNKISAIKSARYELRFPLLWSRNVSFKHGRPTGFISEVDKERERHVHHHSSLWFSPCLSFSSPTPGSEMNIKAKRKMICSGEKKEKQTCFLLKWWFGSFQGAVSVSDEINQAEPVLKRSRRYSEAHVATTEHTEGFHRVEKSAAVCYFCIEIFVMVYFDPPWLPWQLQLVTVTSREFYSFIIFFIFFICSLLFRDFVITDDLCKFFYAWFLAFCLKKCCRLVLSLNISAQIVLITPRSYPWWQKTAFGWW